MTDGFFIGLFALPFLASALTALCLRRASSAIVRYVTLAATAATTLCALLLIPEIGDGPAIVIEWMPGAGPMTLSLGATGLYAASITSLTAFLITLGITPDQVERAALSASVLLLALAAANAAFLAEHFLARYVALEVAALCIALAPLVELKGSRGGRTFWLIYLVLRLGDVGLLSAILILADASGTLEIAPALEAGATLDNIRLGWTVAGLILAVWVKMAGWPFHLWNRFGRDLSLNTHAWLYAIVAPNLGAYLLYRVTPLLTLHPPLQSIALWLGAGGAVLAALITLTQDDQRNALIYLGATQAGLLLFAAACGLKTVVWLALLAMTLLRALLFLAHNLSAEHTNQKSAGFFALGGLAMTAFSLLITWWGRMHGAPLDVLFVAEAAVALTSVWAAREASRVLDQEGNRPSTKASLGQWIAIGTIGLLVLAGGLAFGPLTHRLASSAAITLPPFPSLLTLLRYAVTTPALLFILMLTAMAWWLQKRSGAKRLVSFPTEQGEIYDLEEGLTQAARALHAVVEVGILEQIIALSARGVVEGARAAYRFVEQEGLEGLLRRLVQAILALNRRLKRWHTGLVRRNLLWIPISLALAILAALLY